MKMKIKSLFDHFKKPDKPSIQPSNGTQKLMAEFSDSRNPFLQAKLEWTERYVCFE